MTDTVFTNTEIPRDRYDRPLVIPPGDDPGAKRIPYRRVTTFIKALQDTYAIEEWKKRLVAYGMGQRQDLHLAASALTLEDHHKNKLQKIADDAFEAAEGWAAATRGTALHAHTETVDRGQKVHIPPPFDQDIAAYQQATSDIEWLGIESFRVKDDWQIAGTADRIGRDRHGRVRVYDVKTGTKVVDYPHDLAAQLAAYSRCQPYDVETDTRSPIEEGLDLNTGIIIWLPAGQGICELHEVDIARGWGACNLAKKVWDWRAQKELIQPLHDVIPPPTWDTLIAASENVAEVRAIWAQMASSGHLTNPYRDKLTARANQLKAQTGGPWS